METIRLNNRTVPTYQERVLRFTVERHTELPEEYKEEYRKDGIDPDNIWSLVWSFKNREDAEQKMAEEMADARPHHKFRVVDHGAEFTIERPMY